jgi:hypothetical protein
MIGEGFHLHALYYFTHISQISKGFQVMSASISKYLQWHHRLAHPSASFFNNISPILPKRTLDCEICHFSRSFRLPFKSSVSQTTQIFEIVHSDVWRPFSSSFDDFKYCVTFIDNFFRVTWVYLLKSKCEVFEYFQIFHKLIYSIFSLMAQNICLII